jgi:uncharacterized RDD family membrane protein YckC
MNQFNAHRFETPENVQVSYASAGLGTRFLAWFVDQLLVSVLTIVLFIALVAAGISFEAVFSDLEDGDLSEQQMVLFFMGIMALVWGLGSFLYFCCSELFMRGQTLGKRAVKIRVVKSNGFQLDAGSIVLRNAFRVADQLPPMWVIPFLSKRSQRAGDMVAGTLVVSDAVTELSPVRAALAERGTAEVQFRFDQTMLKRMSADDFAAIERVLNRLPDMSADEREKLLGAFAGAIAKKLRVDLPPPEQRRRFLEDLFVAELRRRDRSLV